MGAYTNQKEICIIQAKDGKGFVKMWSTDYQRASKELNGSEFKLYVYLCDNKDGYHLALSGKAVQDAIGLTINTYQAAVKGLIKAGYLKHKSGNLYEFYARQTSCVRSRAPLDEIMEAAKNAQDETSNAYVMNIGESDRAANAIVTVHLPQKLGDPPPEIGVTSPKSWGTPPPEIGGETDIQDNINNNRASGKFIDPEWTAEQIRRRNKPYRVGSTHPLFATCLDGCPGRCLRDLTRKEAEDIRDKIDRLVPVDDICAEYDMRQSMITSGFWDTYETVEMLYGENAYPILSSFGK